MARTARFGCFELGLDDGELRRSGRRVHLQTQPLRVLAALVSSEGRLVSREELKALIWPSDTFVDFDKSLNTAVMKIRQTLGDSAQTPRFLETVPKLGYRFVAPVIIDEPAKAEEPGAVAGPEAKGPRLTARERWFRAGWMVIGGFVLAGAGFWISRVMRASGGAEFLASEPLTSLPGSEISPSFSPDGNEVAFGWDGPKQRNFSLHVKSLLSGRLRRLTEDAHSDLSPAWAPDGHAVAFLRMLAPGHAALMTVDPRGGEPETVAQIASPSPYYVRQNLLGWSPDSQYLAFSNAGVAGSPQRISLLRLSDRTQVGLTAPPQEFDDLAPAFSRNGRHLAFVRYSGRSSGDLFVLELSNSFHPIGPPKRMTFYDRQAGTPAWSSDARSLFFARFEMPGSPSLWRLDHPLSANARAGPLLISADSSSALTLSDDGSKLIYTREAANTNIWSIRQAEALAAPVKWMANSFVDFNPQYSPDGQRVAFSSTRSGHGEIWIARRDGSQAVQMTHTGGAVSGFPRWSPDGENIVFHLRQKTVAALQILNVKDGSVHPVFEHPGSDTSPSWSRDGKWIYFSSRRSGGWQIWKAVRSGGDPVQVTRHGGWIPLESVDGRYVYFTKLNAAGVWRQPVDGGEESIIVPQIIGAQGTAYAPARHGIFFIGTEPSEAAFNLADSPGLRLAYFDFQTRRTRKIAAIDAPIELGLSISPDEQTILFTRQDRVESDLMVVKNFSAPR